MSVENHGSKENEDVLAAVEEEKKSWPPEVHEAVDKLREQARKALEEEKRRFPRRPGGASLPAV